jgi:GNAT superfamily N-acetyltransferase
VTEQDGYRFPEALTEDHRVDDFVCRSPEQSAWLVRYARQSSATGTTRAIVVTPHGSDDVVGYYAWCMAQIQLFDALERLRKGAGRHPQPVALLARLGVHLDHEGQGIGSGLLQDVFARLLQLSADIGCRGLLVHVESPEARDYYRHLVPEMEPSPTDGLHLVLLMKDIRRTLGR